MSQNKRAVFWKNLHNHLRSKVGADPARIISYELFNSYTMIDRNAYKQRIKDSIYYYAVNKASKPKIPNELRLVNAFFRSLELIEGRFDDKYLKPK